MGNEQGVVGELLPPWKEGLLDLHHINTGRGDCAFYILPDGTTMLQDAGELDGTTERTRSERNAKARPNDTKLAYEWIVAYLKQMWPKGRSFALDHVFLTHFHDDHVGAVNAASRSSTQGGYKLAGLTGVGDLVPFRHLVDRGYPDYDYPVKLESDLARRVYKNRQAEYDELRFGQDNYRAFIGWHQKHNGLTVERFRVGDAHQFGLVNNPEGYGTFEIRNLCCNGEVWTGRHEETVQCIPEISELDLNKFPDENVCSCAIRLRYGNFSYFSGADIPGIVDLDTPSWRDLETPVARSVGAVDVQVLNHHGYRDTQNEFFTRTLSPRVFIQQNWSADQPGQDVFRRMISQYLYEGPRDIFATEILDAIRVVLGESLDRAYRSTRGHIVVRVAPGGNTYHVITLDDTREQPVVKGVFGPYEARG